MSHGVHYYAGGHVCVFGATKLHGWTDAISLESYSLSGVSSSGCLSRKQPKWKYTYPLAYPGE